MARACFIATAIAAFVMLVFVGVLVGMGLYTTAAPPPVQLTYESHDPGHHFSHTPADLGAQLYTRMCASCHSASRDRADNTGPPFYNLYGSERRFTDGTTAIADADYIRESITDPAAKIVEGYPNAQSAFAALTDRELDSLVAFFKAISENHDEPHEPLDFFRDIND